MGKNSIGTGSRLNASALIQDKRIGYSRGDTSIRASLTGGADALLTANVPAAPSIVTTFVLTQEWVNEGGYLSRVTGTFSRYCPLGGTVVTNDYGTLNPLRRAPPARKSCSVFPQMTVTLRATPT